VNENPKLDSTLAPFGVNARAAPTSAANADFSKT
jgi:hypothetical protein